MAPASPDATSRRRAEALVASLLANWPESPPWGERPVLVVVPEHPGRHVDLSAIGATCALLAMGDRQCPVVDLSSHARASDGLVGHHLPESCEAAAVLTENWGAEDNGRSLLDGVKNRPDRFDVRMVSLATRTDAVLAWRRLGPEGWGEVNVQPADDMGTGIPHLATFAGLALAPAAMEPGAVAGAILLRAVAERLALDHPEPDRSTAAERVVAAMRMVSDDGPPSATGASGSPLSIERILVQPVAWEDLRQWAADGWLRDAEPAVARWMTAETFSQVLARTYGTPEEAVMGLAALAGMDLARLLLKSWSPTIDTSDFDGANRNYRIPRRGVGADLEDDDPEWPSTLFGVPLTDAHTAFVEEMEGPPDVVNQAIMGALDVLARDRALVVAAKRSNLAPRQPGDVARLRLAVANTELAAALPMLSSRTAWGEHGVFNRGEGDWNFADSLASLRTTAASRGARYAALAKAVPFFLDAPTAHQIAGAHLPESDFLDYLRLPFRSIFVAFDQDFTFDDVIEEQVDPLAGMTPAKRVGSMAGNVYGLCGGWGTALGMLARHGGGLSGVVLFADDDHRLKDWALWIVTTNNDRRDPSGKAAHTWAVWGHLPHSHLAHVAYNLAAYACWGGWAAPRDLPLPAPATAQWRRAIRSSQFRKGEPRGAALGVHVVRVAPGSATGGGTGAGRSPRPHLRRGFWRRSRIAIRDDHGRSVGPVSGPEATLGVTYTYREHFIAPTGVRGGAGGERLSVYRLPVAADAVETPPDDPEGSSPLQERLAGDFPPVSSSADMSEMKNDTCAS